MKILVTGGAGFIGSHIVDSYVKLGHQVWVIDDESSGRRKQVSKKAKYKKINICNRKKLNAFFANKKFDLVNHHAAQMDVRRSVENPHFDADVNVFGLLNILELCRKHKVKKIIFSASGGTAYGECKKPASEKSPEVPLSPYGISKLAGEKYIQAYASLYGLKYTIFRYGNVYGPRQDPHGEAGVVAIFSNKLLSNSSPFIFGTGRQVRDFVFVGDVARANVLALKKGHNQILNIGTGKAVSVVTLFNTMAKVQKFRKPAIFKKARPGELDRSVLSISKVKRVLGWTPRVTLKSGLTQTIHFFKNKKSLS